MKNQTNVLNHGYVKLIEKWGSDKQIIESARMSTGKGFKGWGPISECMHCSYTLVNRSVTVKSDRSKCVHEFADPKQGDEKLLAYLWRNKHSTPFETAGLMFEIKAPILVFRQWHRHRTFSYNEMSARYTTLPEENYMPSIDRLIGAANESKQTKPIDGSDRMTEARAFEYQEHLAQSYREDQIMYDYALKAGVPKELARIHLPVARYSRMRASANLRNWLAFLTLRLHKHAQYEIRVYAEAISKIISEHYPQTHKLFSESMG